MSCAIAIFVKTPGHSPVKSRLWPDIGRDQAERLHLASATAVASVVARACTESALVGYWATAEAAAGVAADWPGLEHVEQGEGSLGLRMATVYSRLLARHAAAILIGADAPQLESAQLSQAADWLRSAPDRLVIGRANDGGFWLFGGNRELPHANWTGVEYSRADTATGFVHAMKDCGDWLELATLRDIDVAADIAPVRAQLHALEQPTPEQIRLGCLLAEMGTRREQRA
ncbi:DUF2064 domain-containing protein [Dokdonella sp.]|uniref:TIGR04282 family arsenosugar biosynthesis glycosyltransferase n=1 Tax=Dokdonella sp. TaxID=2291710 RepID=UPI003528862B